jgi:monoterpene epsilon-lactone hydrolase
LHADLTGLPPVHTFQGGRDILAADAQLLADRLQQVGNPGTFTFVPGAFHNYLAAFWTPEARAALGAVRQLLRPPA